MAGQLAIDFGTTNTVVTIAEAGAVRILHLPGLAREQPAEQSLLIPSTVHLAETVRRWPCFRQRVPQVQIGQKALSQNFGGGTLDLAVVRLGPGVADGGAAQVLAKHMVRLGGSDVDRWILESVLMDFSDLPHWEYHARWEAMRVKEQVSRDGSAEFRWNGIARSVDRRI